MPAHAHQAGVVRFATRKWTLAKAPRTTATLNWRRVFTWGCLRMSACATLAMRLWTVAAPAAISWNVHHPPAQTVQRASTRHSNSGAAVFLAGAASSAVKMWTTAGLTRVQMAARAKTLCPPTNAIAPRSCRSQARTARCQSPPTAHLTSRICADGPRLRLGRSLHLSRQHQPRRYNTHTVARVSWLLTSRTRSHIMRLFRLGSRARTRSPSNTKRAPTARTYSPSKLSTAVLRGLAYGRRPDDISCTARPGRPAARSRCPSAHS